MRPRAASRTDRADIYHDSPHALDEAPDCQSAALNRRMDGKFEAEDQKIDALAAFVRDKLS